MGPEEYGFSEADRAILMAAREEAVVAKFKRGDRVRKVKGSSWNGWVCGEYSTTLTPEGYAVESEREPGSVQIYPGAALELVQSTAVAGDGTHLVTKCGCKSCWTYREAFATGR